MLAIHPRGNAWRILDLYLGLRGKSNVSEILVYHGLPSKNLMARLGVYTYYGIFMATCVAPGVLGERESGTQRLEEAVQAYRLALEEWTRERVRLSNLLSGISATA